MTLCRYKKKLEEAKDQLSEADSKKGSDDTRDMSNFYGNLMRRNVAFGSGHGGRIREQQSSERHQPITRYGLDTAAAEASRSDRRNVEKDDANLEDEEGESFGPVRRK